MIKRIADIFHNRLFHLIGRFILGSVFIYASIDKIAFPKDFAEIVINYHILPQKIAAYFAYLLPWIELILGICLLIGLYYRESAFVLSLFLIVFVAAIIIKSATGTLENCGCFSVSNQDSSHSIFPLIIRDIFLIFLGAILFWGKTKMISTAAIHDQMESK